MTLLERSELTKRIGHISQIGGLRRYLLLDGRARGVEAVDFRTGTGLCFTVLPGRGMDIAWGEYKSLSLTHITKNGIVGPEFYEREGLTWLRIFFGGVLTTCGLSNVGWPCEEHNEDFGFGQAFGLHDRATVTPAEDVSIEQNWQGERYLMRVKGRVRETCFKGEDLSLTREITTALGENGFTLHDVVENATRVSVPLMLLYHFNFGYPLLDEGAELVCRSVEVTPDNEDAEMGLAEHRFYGAPRPNFKDQVFHHNLQPDETGCCSAGIINRRLELGVVVRFPKSQLPYFAQWKVLCEGDYITGLEPANCYAEGRVKARENNRLQMIEPGEKKDFRIEYKVLVGTEALDGFVAGIQALEPAGF